MTKTFFTLAALLLFPLAPNFAFASSTPKTCAWLLQSQKPAEELLRRLHVVTPDAKSRVEWIWIADNISLTELKDLKISAHAAGLQVVFDQFLADKNRVVGHFHLNGTIRQQAAFASLAPEIKGVLKWTEAFTPNVEKRPLVTWEKVSEDLGNLGFAVVPFRKGLSGPEREMVVFSLVNDTYLSPRIAHVFEQENLELRDLGKFDDFESAFKAWKPGGYARVQIGSDTYLLAEREMLEAIRSIKKTDFLESGLKPDFDLKPWLEKRIKVSPPAKPKKLAVGPAPAKAPAQYGFTDWTSGKYKTSFKEDSVKKGAVRPFSIVRWSKAPAWAVVNAHYLEEHGVHGTLSALEAFVSIAVRKSVLAQLEEYISDPAAFKSTPHTRLSGDSGKALMNKMIEEDLVKVFAPRNSPEDRVLVFPLGTVRATKHEDPPSKEGGVSLLNGVGHVDHQEVVSPPAVSIDLIVRETPAARIEFTPGTGYQSKLVDLNSFEEQVLAAARALPGEGDVAVEQDNQGMLMRFHVAYRAEEGKPVQVLSLRRLDESEIVPRRLEFAPSVRVEKIVSDQEDFKSQLFKGVNFALPSPVDYAISEILVGQDYQGKRESLRVRFSEHKGTILVQEIAVQSPLQRDAFYQRFATYHQMSSETLQVPDIRVGTKRVSAILIPPDVRARDELEYGITQDMEKRILSEVKMAARQPASRTYLSRVQVESQDFVVSLRMRAQTAILKEIYPAN